MEEIFGMEGQEGMNEFQKYKEEYEKLKAEYDKLQQDIAQLYEDPETRPLVKKLYQKIAGVELEDPAYAKEVEARLKPLKEELKEVKQKLKQKEENEKKEQVVKLLEANGLDPEKDAEKLAEFMASRGITNLEYGIAEYKKNLVLQNRLYGKRFIDKFNNEEFLKDPEGYTMKTVSQTLNRFLGRF